jgi:hypothetical protein
MAAPTTPQTTTTTDNTTTTTTPSENTNNTSTTIIDDYPTVTIIDNAEKNERQRKACGCFPERTVVVAIFSMYFFWGIIQAAAFLSSLPMAHSTQSQLLNIFIAVVSLFLVITSAIGLNAMYKQNAKLMRRLSIVFIVLTFMTLAFSVTEFTLDVVNHDDLVSQCNQAVQQDISDASDIDCNQLVKIYLVREGFYGFFLEMIQFYFAYVIFRHARGMVAKPQYPYPLAATQNSDAPPTYFVYASQGVPTSDNWVPPPTYNGNPNNIPVSGDNKFAEGV